MWTENKLNELLTTPSNALINDLAKLDGDIMVLGAGGKMGPTLCVLAKKALEAAGVEKKVYAVSRFSDPIVHDFLAENDVQILSCNLLNPNTLQELPDVKNIIFMAGKKFGTFGNEYATWGMNAWLPSRVAERFASSRIVVFSSGNIYPRVPVQCGGATELTPTNPIGEYAMSCLSRERMFEYAAKTFGTPVSFFRLNYAVDLRYGVLFDIASKVMSGESISLSNPSFNCIWQKDANEAALRLLNYATPDVFTLNVTGPEIASIEQTAKRFGALFGKEPIFEGTAPNESLISNASKMFSLFGYPSVSLNTMIEWQAEWILSGGRSLGKPTHFEESKGKY